MILIVATTNMVSAECGTGRVGHASCPSSKSRNRAPSDDLFVIQVGANFRDFRFHAQADSTMNGVGASDDPAATTFTSGSQNPGASIRITSPA